DGLDLDVGEHAVRIWAQNLTTVATPLCVLLIGEPATILTSHVHPSGRLHADVS
ncbi:MAG: hypothetical protein ACJATT_002989, partial [Myxococcota bacterium]